MAQWSPIDPADIVDLWFDWADPAAAKPFLPAAENIAEAVVTVPDGITKVTEDIDGKKVRWRTGPNAVGKHLINCHITTDTGQEFNMDNLLVVKERVKK